MATTLILITAVGPPELQAACIVTVACGLKLLKGHLLVLDNQNS